jgi:hypothetical protein
VAVLFLFVFHLPADVVAQTTTGTVRGRVTNETGQAVSAATVTARNVERGVERSTLTNAEGVYVLAGVQPGSYEMTVETLGYSAQPRTVRVLIGQSLTVDLQLQPEAIELTGLTVVGTRAVETRTPEIATNVTEEQIESLPQQDRNFLTFAGLAPGVTVNRAETNKQIRAGGLPASKINVFVDGASFKNDVLEGGLHGQDASRGNPFPQLALQEFRVITQNFKAEYQRAASAVVTATTKTGTNEFQLDGFVLGQNKGLVELDPGAKLICDERQAEDPPRPCDPKPEYERLQLGLSAGGPIVRDRLHYFGAYEGNIQNRESIVSLGRPEFADEFGQYEGSFEQPFRSHLITGKLSYQPGDNQTLDLSWNGRFESDKRGFGGQTSFESAEDVRISYNVLTLQHTVQRGDWFNQAHVSGQRSTWNPTAVNDDQEIGLNYQGIIRIGARNTEQRFVQDRIAFRNDLTRFGVEWNGTHVIKVGGNVDFLNYDVEKRFSGNPEFFFDPEVSLTVPVRAQFGEGDPGMDESNVQFGFFIQDDWDVTDRLQLNLGIRWDAETNQFNNKWETPDSIRQRFAGFDFAEGRFTDGPEDRPMYLGAFQPRVGFSFDVLGTGRTVVHGGFGIYYDREVWNHLIDERFRLQWRVRNFEFTSTGEEGKIPWQDSYLSPAGLESLIAQASQPVTAEVFLLENDAKPPRSHQWSLGVRQAVSGLQLGAAYRGVRGYNLLSWYCGAPHPEHGFCSGGREVLGLPYDPILSANEGRSWYDALDLTLEKPFTVDSRWGFTVAYTLADARRRGQEFFTLEYPNVDPEDWPTEDQNLEKHRVIASGIVGLPWDVRASTLIQWGTGIPYDRIDETIGFGPARAVRDFASQNAPNFSQVDARLEKAVVLPGRGEVGVTFEVINLFDHENFREFQQLAVFPGGEPNAQFRRPQPGSADTGRRLQFGLSVGF